MSTASKFTVWALTPLGSNANLGSRAVLLGGTGGGREGDNFWDLGVSVHDGADAAEL